MAATSATKVFRIDAGHRVFGHGGKCNHIHGHSYTIELTVAARFLDGLEMVIDFSILKERMGKWLDDNWDHGMLLNSEDPLRSVYETDPAFDGMKVFVFVKKNPTAEVLARFLYELSESMFPEVIPCRVRVWETPTCYAEYPDKET